MTSLGTRLRQKWQMRGHARFSDLKPPCDGTTADFNIVLPVHPRYPHTLALADIGQLLALSIRSLGHSCRFEPGTFDPGARNIVLAYQVFKRSRPPESKALIVYQLEQLSHREGWFSNRLKSILKAATAVWDYSGQNVEFLHRQGISQARLLPIGFHPGLETIVHREPEIDVLFYGSMNQRRGEIIERLSRRLEVKVLTGVYGRERDEFISRSRIVLNMHYYSSQIMEQARISFLLNNRCFVVTESSPQNPFAGGVIEADYDRLVERCLYFADRPAERQAVAEKGYRLMQARPMTELLRPLLGAG